MKSWIDLTPGLTEKGKELPVGRVLIFDFEGSPIHIRIMRKYKGKIWGKEVKMYRPEDISIVPKKTAKNPL